VADAGEFRLVRWAGSDREIGDPARKVDVIDARENLQSNSRQLAIAASGARKSTASAGGDATRTQPSGADSVPRARRSNSPAQRAICSAAGTSCFPDSVNSAPRLPRRKSWQPSRSSNSAILRLIVGCPSPRLRAAALKLRASATARKVCASCHDISIYACLDPNLAVFNLKKDQ